MNQRQAKCSGFRHLHLGSCSIDETKYLWANVQIECGVTHLVPGFILI